MKVWVDLANSPHPMLFAPVVRCLRERGHDVVFTARDYAQTVQLARERFDDVTVIGGPSPKERPAKVAQLARRVRDLRAWAAGQRPDVALSHNSYAQIVAARLVRVRTVTAMDYEHQPANHLAFRLAHRVLLPEALRGSAVARQGARDRKVRWYPGLKEELYLGEFAHDPDPLGRLGVARARDEAIVVARTPPSRALYHRSDNTVFPEAIMTVADQPHVHCIVLTRYPEQCDAVRSLSPNVTVPTAAVEALSVMRQADLVIGAGGTMTREAALLGVPTVSVFAGPYPAVDAWLEERGRLRRVSEPADLLPIVARQHPPDDADALRERGRVLVELFVDAVLDAGDGLR